MITVPASQLGRAGRHRVARMKCLDCGAERWIETRNGIPRIKKGKMQALLCKKCSAKHRGIRMTGHSRKSSPQGTQVGV